MDLCNGCGVQLSSHACTEHIDAFYRHDVVQFSNVTICIRPWGHCARLPAVVSGLEHERLCSEH